MDRRIIVIRLQPPAATPLGFALWLLAWLTAASLPAGAAETAFERDVRDGDRLEVRNYKGSVRIVGWDRKQLRVEADHPSDEEILLERRGSKWLLVPTAWRQDSDDFELRLPDMARQILRMAGVNLGYSARRLAPAARELLGRRGERLSHREGQLRLLDPRNVLRRGFSLTRDGEGRLVRSVKELAAGDELVTQVMDGELKSRIETIRVDKTYGKTRRTRGKEKR